MPPSLVQLSSASADDAVVEFEDQDRVVVAVGLVAVDLGAHLGVDGLDRRPAEHPAKELDGVAAHVHGDAAAGALDVPEVRRVRAVVLFGLFEQCGLAQRAGIEELFQADVFGGEAKLLGIHQFHVGLAAGRDHPVGFGQIQAERLFHDDVLAGAAASKCDLAVQVIRHADDDHIDLRHGEELPIIGKGARDVVFRCEGLDVTLLPGGHRQDLRLSALLQRFRVNGGDELRSDDSHPHGFDSVRRAVNCRTRGSHGFIFRVGGCECCETRLHRLRSERRYGRCAPS